MSCSKVSHDAITVLSTMLPDLQCPSQYKHSIMRRMWICFNGHQNVFQYDVNEDDQKASGICDEKAEVQNDLR